MIYIDAGHAYEEVKRDTEVAVTRIRPDGVLIFNDYIMTDPIHDTPYGIVQAVNELVVSSDWKVIAFALNSHMYCDIALRRSPD